MPGLYQKVAAEKADWVSVKLSDADLEGIANILHRAFLAAGGAENAALFAPGMLTLRSVPSQGTFAVQNVPGMFKGNIVSAAPQGLARAVNPGAAVPKPTGRRGRAA